MSASKCARCDKTVYPVEGLRCLDKIWHKGCFKCHECNMTLNMKNYKGFEKRPYCNAHCPQAKATTVADTPEIRRLAENTRIQSQAKYHEDFEKSKGKNFTTIADDPETRRVKETSKIISNASYHGDMEKKKHMEERRSSGGQDEVPINRISSNQTAAVNNIIINNNNNNNNNTKHQNRMQSSHNNHHTQNYDAHDLTPTHQQAQQQQYQQHQQRLLQQQQQQQQQQLQMKQQYVQPAMARQPSSLVDNHHHQHHHQQQHQHQQHQPAAPRNVQQHAYSANHQQQIQLQLHQQQQQQLLMRQQQHQQQIIMQQHRQSMDASIPIARQVSKQAIISSTQDHPMMKQPVRGQAQQQQQQQLKYMPLADSMNGQPLPQHLVGVPPHMLPQMAPGGGAMPAQQNRRLGPNSSHPTGQQQQQAAAQQHHAMMQGYIPHPVGSMNGIMPGKHAANMQAVPHMMQHPDQMHPQQRLMMQPAAIGGQPLQQLPHQVPRRVFRAMYDYVANDVDEVSFLENDILVDCVNVDRNWLIGKVARSGQTGMLPANYVEPLPSQ